MRVRTKPIFCFLSLVLVCASTVVCKTDEDRFTPNSILYRTSSLPGTHSLHKVFLVQLLTLRELCYEPIIDPLDFDIKTTTSACLLGLARSIRLRIAGSLVSETTIAQL